jgi:flagellar protein FliL
MPDEQTAPTTQETPAEPEKKKGRGKKLIILFLLVLILAGGGVGGFYYWRHRTAAQARAGADKDKKGAEKHSVSDADIKEVIELQPFIVNLADKNENRYLRMTISLGVGESTEKADPIFTTKVRNAILATITNKTSEQVLTVEGKAALRKEMLDAARTAVEKPEVHAIYITDFIVQM